MSIYSVVIVKYNFTLTQYDLQLAVTLFLYPLGYEVIQCHRHVQKMAGDDICKPRLSEDGGGGSNW